MREALGSPVYKEEHVKGGRHLAHWLIRRSVSKEGGRQLAHQLIRRSMSKEEDTWLTS